MSRRLPDHGCAACRRASRRTASAAAAGGQPTLHDWRCPGGSVRLANVTKYAPVLTSMPAPGMERMTTRVAYAFEQLECVHGADVTDRPRRVFIINRPRTATTPAGPVSDGGSKRGRCNRRARVPRLPGKISHSTTTVVRLAYVPQRRRDR